MVLGFPPCVRLSKGVKISDAKVCVMESQKKNDTTSMFICDFLGP